MTSEPAHRVPTGRESHDPFVVGPQLLAAGADTGSLSGRPFAVKDVFDVAGIRTGAGNPEFLASAAPAPAHAPAVAALLAAGADLVGKTVTDEFAYSLVGTNCHYGTPRNLADPDRVPGGSSSGSASAVAGGLVPVALGTDTGGSIRVPASYCGVLGLRTSHGRISRVGVFPLAPTLDTVGPLAWDASVLRTAWQALRDGASATQSWPTARPVERFVVLTELVDLLDPAAVPGFRTGIKALSAALRTPVEIRPAPDWFNAEALGASFRAIQMHEVWSLHGDWYEAHAASFGPGIGARLAESATVTDKEADRAREARAEFAERFSQLLGTTTYLLQPAAPGPAPLITGEQTAELRQRALGLTAAAGLAGAPGLVLPLARAGGLPLGVCVVGRPGDDDALADLAVAATPAP